MELRSVRTTLYLAAGIGIILSVFSGLELVYASLSQICSVNSFFSCSAVAHSNFALFLYLPDWLWGLGGFIVIVAVAAMAERFPFDPRWSLTLLGLTAIGVALSFYFLYVQLALIGAFCIVCSSSYVMGFICFGAVLSIARRTHEKEPTDEEP